jgi:short-subunit dehydrogenase
MRERKLDGKWALVTGSSAGLGVAFGKELAALGANLILVARREERLQEVRDEIRSKHLVEIDVIPMDLAADGAAERLYERVKAAGRQVDVLINNAGFGIYGEFTEIDWEQEEDMLHLDIVTVVHLTKLFVQDMVRRDYGYILQIASVGAYQPAPMYASYSAAKSFVLSFGEALNYELRDSAVSCTVLSPGVTRTAFREVAGQGDESLYYRLTMMEKDEVARAGVEAMLAGKPSLVPGRINGLLAWVARVIPRRMATHLAHQMTEI